MPIDVCSEQSPAEGDAQSELLIDELELGESPELEPALSGCGLDQAFACGLKSFQI